MAKNAIVLKRATEIVSLDSYGPELIYARGEPYFAEPDLERPHSVWSAIHALQANEPERWAAMARELYGLRRRSDAAKVMAEGVLWKIKAVNTCEGTNPVRIWIDPEGKHWVEVYARRRKRNSARVSG